MLRLFCRSHFLLQNMMNIVNVRLLDACIFFNSKGSNEKITKLELLLSHPLLVLTRRKKIVGKEVIEDLQNL